MGLINELLDWLIRIKAAKSVEVFADELVSRFAIRGAKRRRTDRHHGATSGRRRSSSVTLSSRNHISSFRAGAWVPSRPSVWRNHGTKGPYSVPVLKLQRRLERGQGLRALLPFHCAVAVFCHVPEECRFLNCLSWLASTVNHVDFVQGLVVRKDRRADVVARP